MQSIREPTQIIYLFFIFLFSITILNHSTEVIKIPNFAIFTHLQFYLINFQTNSHNIKNLQSIIKNTLFTFSTPYGHNTPSILYTSLQIFFSALLSVSFPKPKLCIDTIPPTLHFLQHVCFYTLVWFNEDKKSDQKAVLRWDITNKKMKLVHKFTNKKTIHLKCWWFGG